MVGRFWCQALLSGLLFAGAAHAKPPAAALISAQSIPNFVKQMEAMGFKISDLEQDGSPPSFGTEIDGHPTNVLFGGCTEGKACKYVLLLTSFSDIVNPPPEFLNHINRDYDMIGVFKNDRDKLAVQHGIVLGTDGIPITTFRKALEYWSSDLDGISDDAIKAGIVTK